MTRNLVCSECKGILERGYVVETAGIGQQFPTDASYWMEGIPERNLVGTLKTKGKKRFYISAYRCKQCGLLKFYAGPDNSEPKE